MLTACHRSIPSRGMHRPAALPSQARSSASRLLTRSARSSRIRSIRSAPVIPRRDGSSVSQRSTLAAVGCSRTASSPMITTRSTRARRSGSIGFGYSPSKVAPIAVTETRDSALRLVPGFVPAECTSTRSPATARIRAAAICDLPPFFTQRNRTLGGEVAMPDSGTGR